MAGLLLVDMNASSGKVKAKPDLRYEPISFTEMKLLSGYKISHPGHDLTHGCQWFSELPKWGWLFLITPSE